LIEQGVGEKIEQKIILEILAIMKPICIHVPETTDPIATAQYSTLLQILKHFLQNNYQKISFPENPSFTSLVRFLTFTFPKIFSRGGGFWKLIKKS